MNLIEEYLTILDDKSIETKEQFFLKCSIQGLDIDDQKFSELIRAEIDILRCIGKFEEMFENSEEQSLFSYKKVFHLVLSYKEEIAQDSLCHITVVKFLADDGQPRNFTITNDMLEDMKVFGHIDPSTEIFNLMKFEGLKRNDIC